MTVILTSTEITQFQAELANYPPALAALAMIEECEGDLEDAAISLAIRAGQEPDTSDRWLDGLAKRWRHIICQVEIKEGLQVRRMADVVESLVTHTDLPPRLAAPVAIYVAKVGVQDFCQSFEAKLS